MRRPFPLTLTLLSSALPLSPCLLPSHTSPSFTLALPSPFVPSSSSSSPPLALLFLLRSPFPFLVLPFSCSLLHLLLPLFLSFRSSFLHRCPLFCLPPFLPLLSSLFPSVLFFLIPFSSLLPSSMLHMFDQPRLSK